MAETRAQHRRRVTSLTWDDVESKQDVFRNILSRLSVRSIRSVKTVNRYWYGSVRDKHFATIHLAQSRKKPSYIACPRVNNAMELYLLKPGKFNYRHHATVDPPGRSAEHQMHMIASFNGLVCCINQLSDEHEEDYQIWICNPSTEQTLLLPQGRPSFWTEPSIGVAYGPDISEYKIFRMVNDGDKITGEGFHIECEVYSSSTGAWRIIGAVPHLPMYVFLSPHRSSHVFVGGKIYWLVSLEDPGIILYVDMEERFGVMELPHYPTELREEDRITDCTYLINLGGSLSLVVLHGDYFDIWVWKEASWVLETRDEFEFLDDDEIVLFLTSSDKEILCVTGSHMWTYHFNTRKWEKRGGPPTQFSNPAMFPFTESLLPCNGGVRLEGR